MDIKASGINKDEVDKPCIKIHGKISCYDPNPVKNDKCHKVGSSFFCEMDVKGSKVHTTFQKEARKLMNAMLYPKIRTEEARHVERSYLEYTIGFIAASLVFTVSLYIKSIIDYIISFFVDGEMTLITLIVVVILIITISMAISFIQYRASKAVSRTNLLETIAEKDITGILNEMVNTD